MITVDKNVPLPEATGKRNRKYPWKDMQIGDSFFVANITRNRAGSICNGGMKWNPGKRFSYRTVEGGVRVWRVE